MNSAAGLREDGKLKKLSDWRRFKTRRRRTGRGRRRRPRPGGRPGRTTARTRPATTSSKPTTTKTFCSERNHWFMLIIYSASWYPHSFVIFEYKYQLSSANKQELSDRLRQFRLSLIRWSGFEKVRGHGFVGQKEKSNISNCGHVEEETRLKMYLQTRLTAHWYRFLTKRRLRYRIEVLRGSQT